MPTTMEEGVANGVGSEPGTDYIPDTDTWPVHHDDGDLQDSDHIIISKSFFDDRAQLAKTVCMVSCFTTNGRWHLLEPVALRYVPAAGFVQAGDQFFGAKGREDGWELQFM